jgi:hypothetical protein
MNINEEINLAYKVLHLFIYIGYYAYIIIFTIMHRKDIYRAACGGNGMPQPNELVKLFSVYSLAIYSNEVIHQNTEFNFEFGLFLLGCIGIANMGKFKLEKFKETFMDKEKKEEETKE